MAEAGDGRQDRVLMIIDAPDDLEQLISPPGLKEAVRHADRRSPRPGRCVSSATAGTDLTYRCGEYPVMSQWGFADEPGHFDHWAPATSIPSQRRHGERHRRLPARRYRDPAYCRYVHDTVRLEIRDGFVTKVEGRLDAKLMRDWLDDNKENATDRDPYAVSHLGWASIRRRSGTASRSTVTSRSAVVPRRAPSPAISSSRPGPNAQGGGKRTTRGHYDVPMRDCTVVLDNEIVIERGKIVDEKMRVARVRH